MKTLNQQHADWMGVTASALNRRHMTNGYKGLPTQQFNEIKGKANNEKSKSVDTVKS